MRESSTAQLTVPSADAMRAIGAGLGRALSHAHCGPIVIAIEGELGAGKTTLVAGLLGAMGAVGPVRSPTYTLIEPYELGEQRVYHLDLYRLASPEETEALGLRDLLAGRAVLLIEWPSRGAGMLPTPDLAIEITYDESAGHDGRCIRLAANSRNGNKLLSAVLCVAPELRAVSL